MKQKRVYIYKRIEKKLIENGDFNVLESFNSAKLESDKRKSAYLLGKFYRNQVFKNRSLKIILEKDFRDLRNNLFDEGLSQFYDGLYPNVKLENKIFLFGVLIFGLLLLFLGLLDTMNKTVSVGLNYRLQRTVVTGPLKIFFGILTIIFFYHLNRIKK